MLCSFHKCTLIVSSPLVSLWLSRALGLGSCCCHKQAIFTHILSSALNGCLHQPCDMSLSKGLFMVTWVCSGCQLHFINWVPLWFTQVIYLCAPWCNLDFCIGSFSQENRQLNMKFIMIYLYIYLYRCKHLFSSVPISPIREKKKTFKEYGLIEDSAFWAVKCCALRKKKLFCLIRNLLADILWLKWKPHIFTFFECIALAINKSVPIWIDRILYLHCSHQLMI